MPPKKTTTSTTAQRRSTRTSTKASDTNTDTTTNGGTATGQDMGNILSSATKSVKSKKSQKNMAKTAKSAAVTPSDAAVVESAKSTAAKGKRKNQTVAAPEVPETTKKVKTAPPVKKQPASVEDWFNVYASSEDPNEIDIAGILKLLDELDVNIEGASIYVLSWKLGCPTMGSISKKHWVEGMTTHKIKNNQQLLAALPKWLEEAKPTSPPSEQFRTFYKFMFQFAKASPETRSVALDTAVAFFDVALNPVSYDTKFNPENSQELDSSVHPYPHVKPFVQFLNEKQPVKVINKDQWESFITFNTEIHYNLDNYNPEGAWPGLYDQYVEWRKETEGLQIGPKDGPDTEN